MTKKAMKVMKVGKGKLDMSKGVMQYSTPTTLHNPMPHMPHPNPSHAIATVRARAKYSMPNHRIYTTC